MTPAAAIELLNHARSLGVRCTGDWELRVRPRDGELEYQVMVRAHRRNADGRVGKRWGRPIFSDWHPILADHALVEAAELLAIAYPEVIER